MTPEQIQEQIEGMLAVQRELQESQLRQQTQIEALLELSKTHEKRFAQFYGYHQAAAGDQSHLEEEVIDLKMRIKQLEDAQ